MADHSANELAKMAEGNIISNHLTDTGTILKSYLDDSRLMKYFDRQEQPEYIYSASKVGYELIDSYGNKRKQDTVHGKSYTLVRSQTCPLS
jgi:hypothetical protein